MHLCYKEYIKQHNFSVPITLKYKIISEEIQEHY